MVDTPSENQTASEHPEEPIKKRRISWLAILPLAVVLPLFGLFWYQTEYGNSPSFVPSPFIGKAAPTTDLNGLPEAKGAEGQPIKGVSNTDFKGKVTLVNFWASWCVGCRQEHAMLMKIATDKRIQMIGINSKDSVGAANNFLVKGGNPFSRIGQDASGRLSIDWGVYGMPETFVVDRNGIITAKHIGPISQKSFEKILMPAIEKALMDKNG